MIREVFPTKADRFLGLPRAEREELVRRELLGRKVDFFASEASYDPDRKEWSFRNGSFISYDRNEDLTVSASGTGISAIHEQIPFTELRFGEEKIHESPNDILNAIKEKDDLPTWVIWDLIRRTPNMADRVESIYMTVFFYRLAFPWACFLAVFLGIPLATKNERTGSLLAIITAVVIIVVYIVAAQVFLVLGKGGILNPVFAGLAPTVAFIAFSAYRIFHDRN